MPMQTLNAAATTAAPSVSSPSASIFQSVGDIGSGARSHGPSSGHAVANRLDPPEGEGQQR